MFKPNDRVIYTGKAQFANETQRGKLATFVELCTDDNKTCRIVFDDEAPDMSRIWCSNIEPAPITVGTHVRWNTECNTRYVGKVTHITDKAFTPQTNPTTHAYLAGGFFTAMSQLVAVTEPTKAEWIPPNFTIDEDGSVRILVEAANFRVLPETLSEQIERLANYITENIPGEPSQTQGTVDTALCLLRQYRSAIWDAAEIFKTKHDTPSRMTGDEWLSFNDPNPTPIKRGDLVTWNHGINTARVTGDPAAPTVEVMYVNAGPGLDGKFENIEYSKLRLVK